MVEEVYDYTKIFPSTTAVDLSKLDAPLSTKEGFSKAVTELGLSERLPKLFPRIPDIFNKNKITNIVIDRESENDLLTLPKELYNSETYERNPILRGPMEEIILANENERIRCGFSRNQITGDGWSELFRERFDRLKPIIGPVETGILSDEEKKQKLPENPKGTKIA